MCLLFCCISQGSNETGMFNQISTALYSSELAHSEILVKSVLNCATSANFALNLRDGIGGNLLFMFCKRNISDLVIF